VSEILQCFLLKEMVLVPNQRMIQLFISLNVNATDNSDNEEEHDPDTVDYMSFGTTKLKQIMLL